LTLSNSPRSTLALLRTHSFVSLAVPGKPAVSFSVFRLTGVPILYQCIHRNHHRTAASRTCEVSPQLRSLSITRGHAGAGDRGEGRGGGRSAACRPVSGCRRHTGGRSFVFGRVTARSGSILWAPAYPLAACLSAAIECNGAPAVALAAAAAYDYTSYACVVLLA